MAGRRLIRGLGRTYEFRDDRDTMVSVTPTVNPRMRLPWENACYNVWTIYGHGGQVMRERAGRFTAYTTVVGVNTFRKTFDTLRKAVLWLADLALESSLANDSVDDLRRKVERKVNGSRSLTLYRDVIMLNWQSPTALDHFRWVLATPEQTIVNWALDVITEGIEPYDGGRSA